MYQHVMGTVVGFKLQIEAEDPTDNEIITFTSAESLLEKSVRFPEESGQLFWTLIQPETGGPVETEEGLSRVALGTPACKRQCEECRKGIWLVGEIFPSMNSGVTCADCNGPQEEFSDESYPSNQLEY